MFRYIRSLFLGSSGEPVASLLDPGAAAIPFPSDEEAALFTEPRDADGYVDYETALNRHLRGEIKPDDNALALLIRAIGRKPGGEELPAAFFEWLGTPPPPMIGSYLVPLASHFKVRDGAEFEHQLRAITATLWTTPEDPAIAVWLQVNEAPLAVAAEASKRPAYFLPITSRDGERGTLFESLFPVPAQIREIALLFCLRATLRAGEGRLTDSWEDVFTALRLGRLVSQGGTMIELLVGVAIEQVATQTVLGLIESTRPPVALLQAVRRQLAALPPVGTLEPKITVTERVLGLEVLQAVHRDGLQVLNRPGLIDTPINPQTGQDLLFRQVLDWQAVMAGIHQLYERVREIHRRPTHARRVVGWAGMARELEAAGGGAPSFDRKVLLGLRREKDRKAYTESFAKWLTKPTFGSVQQVSTVVYRAAQVRANVSVAIALAEHYADTRDYPERLDTLVPTYLSDLPGDLFSDKQLIYKQAGDGYLLYSVGPNMTDDDGRTFSDDPPGDDLVVRMPSAEKK